MLTLKNSILILTSGLLFSCSKENQALLQESGDATVTFSVQNVVSSGELGYSGSKTKSASIPFDSKHTIAVTLTPENSSNSVALKSSSIKAATEQKKLDNGTKYNVVVFGDKGEFVRQQVFTAGEANVTFSGLSSGKSYTFISYSNGTNNLDSLSHLPLAQTKITLDGNERFMSWKENINMNEGENNIHILLKHKLSELANVKFMVNSDAIIGDIVELSNANIASISSSIYNFAEDQINYGSEKINKNLTFVLSGRSANSTSSIFLALPNDNGSLTNTSLNIGKLVIGNSSKSNLSIPLLIEPGVRYTLNLNINTFTADPLGIDVGGNIWAPGNIEFTPNNPNDYSQGGVYSFSTLAGGGNFYNYNGLYPISSNYDYTLSPKGDACAEIGQGWRTPTAAEFRDLVNTGVSFETKEGQDGVLIGGKLFLPLLGYENGNGQGAIMDQSRYWTADQNSYFVAVKDWNWAGVNTDSDLKWGYPIRCVK